MNRDLRRRIWSAALPLGFFVAGMCGCAEGPLWRTGHLSPWAKQQWAEEDEIAPSLYAKRERMRAIVEQAIVGGEAQQQKASEFLADIVKMDPVQLMRIEATKLLADLRTETATQALQLASQDRESAVRLAAVDAWRQRRGQESVEMLDEMIRSDQNVDVRLAAIAALGESADQRVAKNLAPLLADPDPAVQMQAAEALASVTGQSFGTDIQAWQSYVANTLGLGSAETAESLTPTQFK